MKDDNEYGIGAEVTGWLVAIAIVASAVYLWMAIVSVLQ